MLLVNILCWANHELSHILNLFLLKTKSLIGLTYVWMGRKIAERRADRKTFYFSLLQTAHQFSGGFGQDEKAIL
jgi:hypothetical protein